MDSAVTNLISTYLDCVKILVNEPWPNDMQDVLDDVVQNTKTFSEQIKSRKLKSKFNKNRSSKTCTRKEAHQLKSRAAKTSTVTLKEIKHEGPSPVVLITRLSDEENAAGLNNVGMEVVNQSTNSSENEIKAEIDESDRREEDLPFREEEGKYSSNCKSDGCVIS